MPESSFPTPTSQLFHPNNRKILMVKSESSVLLEHSEYSEGIDRISSLPKPLLSHILSLLPTKYAVATSLLSTRWRFVWTSITNINFNDEQVSYRYHKKSLDMKRKIFTQFVNRLLLLLDTPYIQNFDFKCGQELGDRFYLDSWICAAIKRTVQKLELHLVLAQPMELPLIHFYCKTLAVLNLIGDIHFNIAASASVCFPNLQTLHLFKVTFTFASNSSVSFPSLKILLLDFVKYANEESVHKLFAACPVLDNLKIKRDFLDNVICLIISVPSLRSLTTSFCCSDSHPEGHLYELHIDTPALKFLNLVDHSMCKCFTARNLSSLLEARVTFDWEGLMLSTDHAYSYSIHNVKFIGGLFNVKFLSVSGYILELISFKIAPGFHNLTRLELGGDSCCDRSLAIKNFLESSKNLEHLVMNGSYRTHCYHKSWWTEPLCVPMCLKRRVTTISFSAMSVECSDELELITYFLKNANVLQLLTVDCSYCSDTKKLKLLQKISMIPRRSRACQVAFT